MTLHHLVKIYINNTYNRKLEDTLDEINILAGKIISNDDQPDCVFDEECPLNGGVGFDNHCNENCPLVSAKQILDIISRAKGEENAG